MTTLPLEIRRMIYARALGGKTVHLQTHKGKPRARVCGLDEPCHCYYFQPFREKTPDFGLGLLRTCRSIYSEAIEYLYSANAFSLSTEKDEGPTVDYISYYFLPQRVLQVRHLHIYWQFDNNPYNFVFGISPPSLEGWLTSWEALSRMTGLQKLHVTLEYPDYNWMENVEDAWREKAVEMLEVVKKIKVKDFVVYLPDDKWPLDFDTGDSKCLLRLAS
ncbi:hypothetical protein ACEQ8H_002474 [Pleosporales sp. CAS-2024a]